MGVQGPRRVCSPLLNVTEMDQSHFPKRNRNLEANTKSDVKKSKRTKNKWRGCSLCTRRGPGIRHDRS